MSRHANISIFVPHRGCPNQCSFCNQKIITRQSYQPSGEDVREAVERAIDSSFGGAEKREIAFFGGSFTAIERDYMCELLSAASSYVKNGVVQGIRISTRPDAIDEQVLDILKAYGVTAIELGAQSMDDTVLALNRRGHTAADVVKASRLIKEYEFSLGLQMMTGLYGDSYEGAVKTAERIAVLSPDTVRIYPTVVLKNTYLADLVASGEFVSDSLEETVELCAKLLEFFYDKNIDVIRLGLHELEEENIVSGPWHPSFGELCVSRIYLNKFINALRGCEKGGYTIYVASRDISKATGQKRSNISCLQNLGYNVKIKGKADIPPFSFEIEGGTLGAAQINRGTGL